MIQRIRNNFSLILKGYGRFAVIVLKTALVLAAAAGINIIFLYPLWYTAINYRSIYTAVTSIAISAAIIIVIAKSIKKRIELEKARGKSPAAFFIKPVVKTVKFTTVLFIIYMFTFLFFKGFMIAAAVGFIIFLLAAGLLLFTGKHQKE